MGESFGNATRAKSTEESGAGLNAEPRIDSSLEQSAREHLQLRLDWARAVAKMRGTDFIDELSRNTDIAARAFGVRRPRSEVENDPRWQRYVDELRTGADPMQTTERLWKQSAAENANPNGEKQREFFGPFRYDYDSEAKEVMIHFGSMAWSPETRDGQPNFSKNLKQSLGGMFKAIKARHPEAIIVGGGSWLFARLMSSEKFSRAIYEILPREFIESGLGSGMPAQGGGRWGQFVDNRGRLHRKRADEFRLRMQNPEIMTEERFMEAFPIQPMVMEAPIEVFYDFYGIKE